MDTVDDDEVLGGGAVDEAHSEAKDREVLAVVEVLEPGSLLVPPSGRVPPSSCYMGKWVLADTPPLLFDPIKPAQRGSWGVSRRQAAMLGP